MTQRSGLLVPPAVATFPPASGSERSAGPEPFPNSVVSERRLTNRALKAWQEAGPGDLDSAMAPFFDNSLIVRDPAGRAVIEAVGGPLAAQFGLVAGLPLLRDPGLGEELVAACELIALQPMPVAFEANVNDPCGAQVMVRGLALPVAESGDPAALVQLVLSWRELLSNSAARRLRAELATAFAQLGPRAATADPFPARPPTSDVIRIT